MADGRVILITGASTGIGAETARSVVEAGWRVVLGARTQEKLEALAEELGGPNVAVARRCDVTSLEDNEALAAAAIDSFGRLDAAFANAGFGAKRGFLEETEEHWRSMVLTNVLGPALTIRAALPHLLEAEAGHMLLTSSVAGRRALPGSLYSATKWAVTGMAESLRQELRQMHENTSVRVTMIAPGMVDTPFFDDRPENALTDRDIAEAALFALTRPDHVDVNEILLRPASQPT
jgi:NADP-dependent 3-hydroxy acid dehydrogenase YdfG